jgi:hypothetical protein
MSKVSSSAIKKELEKLHNMRKKLQTDIEVKTYELKTVEEAMVPLKQAYDQLVKLTGDDLKPESKQKPSGPAKGSNPFAGRNYESKCRFCDIDFVTDHPLRRTCKDCIGKK